MTKYFIFDCETGGFPEKNASLLTMEGTLLDGNLNQIESIDLKIKPDDGAYRIEPRALQINEIDLAEHDKVAIVESEAATIFKDFICRHSIGVKIVPVGHNVSFDVAFMSKLVGIKEWKHLFSKKVIDTASIAEFLCLTGILPPSEDTDCSLGGLAQRFDYSYDGAHNAGFDRDLTLKVLRQLIKLTERTSH